MIDYEPCLTIASQGFYAKAKWYAVLTSMQDYVKWYWDVQTAGTLYLKLLLLGRYDKAAQLYE